MATQKKTEEVVEQTTPVEQNQEPQSNVGAAQVTATPTQTPAVQPPVAEQTQQTTETQQTTQSTTTTPQTSYTQKVTITSPKVDPLEYLDTTTMEDQINKWFETSKQQQENRIDYGTNQGITELQRAEEDAREQFQTQRNQVDIDEAKALDNQALYAEARGDKGGIGQAQYNQIQNAAATNRMTVNKAQTKLATDTARQIADLRAQGEFEKADAVLTLTQNYLSQLFQLGQWAAEFNLSVDQFNASLRQWSAEYEMGMAELGMAQDQWNWQVGQAEKENLANAGWAILDAGIMPSESQLAAMGLTPQQATDLLNTRKLSGSVDDGRKKKTDDPYEEARWVETNDDPEAIIRNAGYYASDVERMAKGIYYTSVPNGQGTWQVQKGDPLSYEGAYSYLEGAILRGDITPTAAQKILDDNY
jgi:bisphosphoglycerate-dependent phosphoglycerate mutase